MYNFHSHCHRKKRKQSSAKDAGITTFSANERNKQINFPLFWCPNKKINCFEYMKQMLCVFEMIETMPYQLYLWHTITQPDQMNRTTSWLELIFSFVKLVFFLTKYFAWPKQVMASEYASMQLTCLDSSQLKVDVVLSRKCPNNQVQYEIDECLWKWFENIQYPMKH